MARDRSGRKYDYRRFQGDLRRGRRADEDGDRHYRGSLHRVERLRHGYLPSYPTMRLLVDGTAQLEGSEIIRVDYSGTTCLGPISGTEILQKQ